MKVLKQQRKSYDWQTGKGKLDYFQKMYSFELDKIPTWNIPFLVNIIKPYKREPQAIIFLPQLADLWHRIFVRDNETKFNGRNSLCSPLHYSNFNGPGTSRKNKASFDFDLASKLLNDYETQTNM